MNISSNDIRPFIISILIMLFGTTKSMTAHSTIGNETVSIRGVGTSPKIIGGSPVAAGTYPFYARLSISSTGGSTGLCGASLVSPEFLLTAAHCTVDATSVESVIGALCDDKDNCGQFSESMESGTAQIFNHPQFNADTYNNDFALIKLPRRSKIEPLAMDSGNISPNYVVKKRNLFVTGRLRSIVSRRYYYYTL
jgi:secreted trypsin-like serine protease